jgi:2-polyprenyl-3-methyl-5-hydroxy-6-metoxy-1,4-benzoquinol methylase
MSAQPSPELFFDTLNAYQRTEALKAALELDLFTAIGEGAVTSPEIAARLEASERGVRILCDYLTVVGFLTKEAGRYGLTLDTATFLNRHSPAYCGTAAKFLASPDLVDGFKQIAAAVRKGGTVAGEGTVAHDHPIWVDFARAMAPLVRMTAEALAKLIGAESAEHWKVLDIAAGHGLFGISVARLNPNATVAQVDWHNVLEVAKENARAAGVADRISYIPGSAFEVEYGSGYDVVLLTNFLHHFDAPTCETLLRKVHAALKPGGRAVTAEFVPNEDRVSPPVPASFSLMMLGSTPSGDAYTFKELDQMFRNAGFASSELHALPPTFQSVVISRK